MRAKRAAPASRPLTDLPASSPWRLLFPWIFCLGAASLPLLFPSLPGRTEIWFAAAWCVAAALVTWRWWTLIWRAVKESYPGTPASGAAAMRKVFTTGHSLRAETSGLLAALTGFLFTLSGPDLEYGVAGFVALLPLYGALDRARSWRESLLLGVIAGATLVFLIFSWGSLALANYADSGPLIGYLLFLPLIFLLSLKFPLFALLFRLNATRLQLPPLLFLPPAFTALEILKIEMYPWYLGLSQTNHLRLAQLADLGGLPMLSFLVVFINTALWQGWRGKSTGESHAEPGDGNCGTNAETHSASLQHPTSPSASSPQNSPPLPSILHPLYLLSAMLVLVAAAIYGEVRLRQVRRAEASSQHVVRVGAIQPNTPSKVLNRDTAAKQKISDTLRRLARQAAQQARPDLLVFAESSAPMGYQSGYNKEFAQVYRELAAELQVPILTDNILFDRRDPKNIYWRTALLIAPDGKVLGEYLKRRLVPFGESLPLPFLKTFFPYAKTYQRGTGYPELKVGNTRLAPQICYEILYPEEARQYARTGADLLLNPSNDSWFDNPKQAHQHLALSRFRAIENRLPMVRVTNTGISAYVSATGEVIGPASPRNQEWSDCRPVALPHVDSVYTALGDTFGWMCVGLTALLIGLRWRNWGREGGG